MKHECAQTHDEQGKAWKECPFMFINVEFFSDMSEVECIPTQKEGIISIENNPRG